MLRKSSLLVAFMTTMCLLFASPTISANAAATGGAMTTVTLPSGDKVQVRTRLLERTRELRNEMLQADGTRTTARLSEGGCGFLQRCIYLNRTEQRYLWFGMVAVVAAAICGGGFGLTCGVAVFLAEIASAWVSDRGSICGTTRPKLRIQYLPWPQVEGCVS